MNTQTIRAIRGNAGAVLNRALKIETTAQAPDKRRIISQERCVLQALLGRHLSTFGDRDATDAVRAQLAAERISAAAAECQRVLTMWEDCK